MVALVICRVVPDRMLQLLEAYFLEVLGEEGPL